MNRQQIDGGHSKPSIVVDHRRRRQSRIGSAQRFRNVRMPLAGALDVNLVEHGIFPRYLGWGVAAPIEGVVGDACLEVIGPIGSGAIRKNAGQFARVRVKQQALRIEAMPGTFRAMNTESVLKTGRRSRKVTVPDLVGAIRERHDAHRAAFKRT